MRGSGSSRVPPDRAVGAVFGAATASFAASLCLGVATAAGASRADPESGARARWAHHVLFVSSSVLCSAAASSVLWGSGRARSGGAAMLPAVGILLCLPRFRGGTAGHALIAASATPFVALAATQVWS